MSASANECGWGCGAGGGYSAREMKFSVDDGVDRISIFIIVSRDEIYTKDKDGAYISQWSSAP